MRGMGFRTDFSHISEMFEDTRMKSGLYTFFHIALLIDFGSFMCMSDMLFESAPLLHRFSVTVCCGVSPECTVAVEISYTCEACFLSQCRESEWFRWWFVHGVYNNTR